MMNNPSLKARRDMLAERWCKRFNRGTQLHDCQELAGDIRALQEGLVRDVLTELGFVEHESGGWVRRELEKRPVFSSVIPKALWDRWTE